MPIQILSTKLTTPPLRPRLVRRTRLFQKLTQGFECGLVLVCAPAGYGKSTLLSAWLSQVEVYSSWLTLDDGDNDPPRFMAYLLAALTKISPSITEALEGTQLFRNQPDVELLLTPLINHLAQQKHPFYLILDDFHLIQDRTVLHVVNFLLENRPPSLHLVIATRADPPLPLSNMRARSEILELRLADLRFDISEASNFLKRTMGIQITPMDVEVITSRTEGWIAGLQIAALSMQHVDDISSYVASLDKSDYYIFDYLIKEVLTRQSPAIQRFLLYTSILEQFTAPLCDAIFTEKLGDSSVHRSADILKELEALNLFLIPLDYEHRWFRYHHLFSDFLRLILEQTYPGKTVELHLRACLWFESQDMILQALQHAISSANMQLVEQVVSANVLVLLETDEAQPTLQMIDSLPQEQIISQPWLAIARAWALGAGQVEEAHRSLDLVEKNLDMIPNELEQKRLRGHAAALRAFVYFHQGERNQVVNYAQLADELLPEQEIAIRALNLAIWGDGMAIAVPDQDEKFIPINWYNSMAFPIAEKALALAVQSRRPHLIMVAAENLANDYLGAYMLRQAHRVCNDALEIAEEYRRQNHRPLTSAANLYAILGRVLSDWGEDEAAIEAAQTAVQLSEHRVQVLSKIQCQAYLGSVLAMAGEWDQARQVLQQAEMLARRTSPWYLEIMNNFILATMMNVEKIDPDEITRQLLHIQESGARLPLEIQVKLAIRDARPQDALLLLDEAAPSLTRLPPLSLFPTLILRVVALQGTGDTDRALESLEKALELAETENRVAPFVREGAIMEDLLRQALARGFTPQYTRHLLAAFSNRHKPKPDLPLPVQTLLEPLSGRELEILKLIAQGCADKRIAEMLFISRGTVHKHLTNIYEKLDVHSRTEAIARGRDLSLL
jgi:LuxR family maltose regulon positive regulatory protein